MLDSGLHDSRVIVTGAGSGIGRATALRFGSEGAKVVVADSDASAAADVTAELRDSGVEAVAVIGDLGDQAVVDLVIGTAAEKFGGIDVLVNNAGIVDGMHAAADLTDIAWDRVLRINLTTPFLLTRAALPYMLSQGKGAFVNVASEAALRGSAAGTAYTVSKHGLVGLTRSVAVMYRDAGIRANAIAPGLTAPSNVRAHRVGTHDADALGPSTIQRHSMNMGRVAATDEQAAAIVFLASDWASNISGALLPVDNGWSAV
jgi:NAD(P)-dependent dehydrogenase (short-subunit alcohol dehydrogenase family)